MAKAMVKIKVTDAIKILSDEKNQYRELLEDAKAIKDQYGFGYAGGALDALRSIIAILEGLK